ncbi:MAG: carbonic anhydrase [Saprospiraceae bacterium]|nr:carbonic anhydrase [Saprospiraceae bacterium]MDW8484702.1 carbonic anhydrase [Saprospiraceae bacterium]
MFRRRAPLFLFVVVILIDSVQCRFSRPVEKRPSTPEAALAALLEGNQRFLAGALRHPHQTQRRVREVENAQHPFAVVVSCSDSRVPPEIIFDEGVGDLFVIRTAGNLLGNLELGSIEYAVEHLGCPLVVVLGHTECGAIKAFLSGGECHGHIRDIIEALRQEKEEQQILQREGKNLNTCIEGNVIHGVTQIRQQPVIMEKMKRKEVNVVPMIYDVHTGKVSVINETAWLEAHAFLPIGDKK